MIIIRRCDPNTAAICDVCGADILSDDAYYRMPDGAAVCSDYDCLEQWAADYLCWDSASDTEDY